MSAFMNASGEHQQLCLSGEIQPKSLFRTNSDSASFPMPLVDTPYPMGMNFSDWDSYENVESVQYNDFGAFSFLPCVLFSLPAGSRMPARIGAFLPIHLYLSLLMSTVFLISYLFASSSRSRRHAASQQHEPIGSSTFGGRACSRRFRADEHLYLPRLYDD